MTVTPPTVAAETPRRSLRRFRSIRGRETWAGLGMIAPAAVLLVLFLIIPVILAFALSFTNARLISPNPPRLVGFDNFARAFTDPVFLQSVGNTFVFALVVVPVQAAFALLLAVLVNRTPARGDRSSASSSSSPSSRRSSSCRSCGSSCTRRTG